MSNPQSWNRYSYVINNPIKLTDPSGHKCVGDDPGCLPGEGGTGKKTIPYQNVNYCNTHPGSCVHGNDAKKTEEDVQMQMDVDGFYLGGQYPETLAEMEEDIYGGVPVDLIDSLSNRKDAVNNAHGLPNVYAGISYSQYPNGTLDITGITVANASDYRVFVIRLQFLASERQLTMGLGSPGLNQFYEPNPLRIVPKTNSDKFMTIDPHSTSTLPLAPSGNPANPNNHFGPSSVQSLTVQVYFIYQPQPNSAVLTFDLIP